MSEIPGTVIRNVVGGSRLIPDDQVQLYRDLRQQYENIVNPQTTTTSSGALITDRPTMADVAGPKEGYISLKEYEDMQRNNMYDFTKSPGMRNRPKEEIEQTIKDIVSAASNSTSPLAPTLVPAQKNACKTPSLPRFTHPLHVQVVRLPALAGVRFRYAESGLLNRRLRSIW